VRHSQSELAQQREPHPIECPDLAAGNDSASGFPEALDALQLETLMLNLDASLRVHERAHFFSWTQGLLQSLIRHEALICALRDGVPLSFRADSFSTIAPDPAIFGEMFLRDALVAPSLIKAWEERHFCPVICAVGNGSQFASGAFARELERMGATQLLAHGTHDADGQVTSFFTFACMPGTLASKQAYLAQLAVPFLHSAWVRTQINGRTKSNDGPKPAEATNVTIREQEILRWIYLGKSNFEIGTILNISPLTVKNHVQKILRKLNVVNRAQAVGKGLDLRILKP
jgi:transcriptional regulator EpsA